MFGFIKRESLTAITFFSFNPLNVNSLECVSIKNQECKTRTKIININTNEPVFYPFSIKVNKCSRSCNKINDAYAKLCVPSVVKNINVRVFNLMSFSNQTRHIEWHETCKFKCRLDSSVCNNKQKLNEDKCRCECRGKLSDKERCDKGFIWNPSNCNCECDKSYDIGQYLDYENCKCRRKIVGELVEECSKNIDENEMIYNETLNTIPLNDYKKVCGSCTLYIVLFVAFSVTSTVISNVFIYFYWYSKKNITSFYY